MITKKVLANARVFVGVAMGEIECIDKDGVFQWRLGYQPGMHFTENLRAYMQDGDQVRLNGEITLLKPGTGRVAPQKYGAGGTETGANPDSGLRYWKSTGCQALFLLRHW